MSYRIVSLRLKNFKCFDNTKFYEFTIDYEKNPIILSGPNGFGKTTFFDALEILFSNSITRLDTYIENRKTNLGKNLLLNDGIHNGYIVLTLQNENHQYKTIFGKISKDYHNIEVTNSVKFGYIDDMVHTEDLEETLQSHITWSSELDFDLRYNKEFFNVYYYVSQAESVHFLKTTLNKRGDVLGELLNIDTVEQKKEIIDKIIGGNTNAKTPINNRIRELSEGIEKQTEEYKKYINVDASDRTVLNIDLGLYSQNNELYYWDNPQIKDSQFDTLKKAELELEALYHFNINKKDFYSQRYNTEVSSLKEKSVVDDYSFCRGFINNSKLNIEEFRQSINEKDRIIQIFNSAQFFLAEMPDANAYKSEDITKLVELIPNFNRVNDSLIELICENIVQEEKKLSTNQSIITKMEEARNSLRNASSDYTSIKAGFTKCPYCNTGFKNKEELDDGFDKIASMLKDEGGEAVLRVARLKAQLKSEVKKARSIIDEHIIGLDNTNIQKYIASNNICKEILADSGRIQNIEKLDSYLSESDFNRNTNDDSLIIEINRVLSNKIRKIDNPDYRNISYEYNFDSIYNKYGNSLETELSNISNEMLTQKMAYISALVSKADNEKASECKDKIKELIVEREKLKRTRKRLDELSKIYKKSIDEYKSNVMKRLRIPLLIYTGKILQDYQAGLGVFIDEETMRFVTNGEGKLDILNTFSSGQLSAFVMAFLFAMNKQYIKESSDDLGFILIDDPVQTMDDINIASLVEVMRNEFGNKQIILSTHELDKENYIFYKFLKHNMIGQSFNVKEELYKL